MRVTAVIVAVSVTVGVSIAILGRVPIRTFFIMLAAAVILTRLILVVRWIMAMSRLLGASSSLKLAMTTVMF